MASQPDYDFVLQLHRDVLRDVQTRVLNASLRTNLALTSPISRVLAQTVTPFQMKAHWAKPSLEIAEEGVILGAEVAGGARYALEGINLTVKGQVKAQCRPGVITEADGQPRVALMAPSLPDLGLGDLELSYQGDDDPLTGLDIQIEREVLRPTLCDQLMRPLAHLPLNYLPHAVPLRLGEDSEHGASPSEGVSFADAAVLLDPNTESLTLAQRCKPRTATPTPPLLAGHTTANVGVAVSQTGLNKILGWLCTQGLAAGATYQSDGLVSWRWAHVAADFTDHTIHLTGQLWHGQTATTVDTELRCSLTSSAQLSVRLTTPQPPPGAAVLIDAWTHLMCCTFFAATRAPESTHRAATELHSNRSLLQRFTIPGTDLTTEAPLVGLDLREGYLIALYAIPPDEQPLTLTLEDTPPKPLIVPLDVAVQEAPGAPVTAQLSALLASSPQPPYDYAWRVDQEHRRRRDRGPTLTITKAPPSTTAEGEPKKLATVSLRVIDILGQVGQTATDVTYYPATPSQEKQDEDNTETPQGQHSEKNADTEPAGTDTTPPDTAQAPRHWTDRLKDVVSGLPKRGLTVASSIVVAILVLIAIPGDPGDLIPGDPGDLIPGDPGDLIPGDPGDLIPGGPDSPDPGEPGSPGLAGAVGPGPGESGGSESGGSESGDSYPGDSGTTTPTTTPGVTPSVWGYASTREFQYDTPPGTTVELHRNWQWGTWRRSNDPALASRYATMTHTGTGSYRVRMPGLGPVPGVAHAELSAGWGYLQATACQIASAGRDGADQIVDVVCFDPAGTAKNLPFLVIYVGASNGPTPMLAARYTGAGTESATSSPVSVSRTSVGRYTLTSSGAFNGRGFARITPVGPTPARCRPAETTGISNGLHIRVECDAPGGAAVDTDWTISYTEQAGMHHDPSVPAAYLTTTGDPANPVIATERTWSSNGETPTITHQPHVGVYRVYYQQIGKPQVYPADTVAITAIGPQPRFCRNQVWNSYSYPPKLLIEVYCFDAAGQPADATFALAYLRAP